MPPENLKRWNMQTRSSPSTFHRNTASLLQRRRFAKHRSDICPDLQSIEKSQVQRSADFNFGHEVFVSLIRMVYQGRVESRICVCWGVGLRRRFLEALQRSRYLLSILANSVELRSRKSRCSSDMHAKFLIRNHDLPWFFFSHTLLGDIIRYVFWLRRTTGDPLWGGWVGGESEIFGTIFRRNSLQGLLKSNALNLTCICPGFIEHYRRRSTLFKTIQHN